MGMDIKAEGKLSEPQMDRAMAINAAESGTEMLVKGWEKYLNYSLMNGMMDLQRDQMTKHYDLQGSLVSLNGSLINSQEKVALKQLTVTKEIAELQKDKDVAIAKTRADAAVKIAKVNALSAQFYGQTTANKLPSIAA
jgi:hypothetical protein